MASILAPKAKQLYEQFVANYEKEETNTDTLRTWEQLSEGEQKEWMEFAGEEAKVMGAPMHHPPIPKQGDRGADGAD